MSVAQRRPGLVPGSVVALSTITLLLCAILGCSSALHNKDPKVRLAAVEKLTDQSKLEKVAFEDPDEQVSETAVARLTGQAILAKIATQHKNDRVRFTAVAYLTDPVTLDQIVHNEKEGILTRQFANKRLQEVTGVNKYEFGH